MQQRINNTIQFLADATGMTTISTAPYQFSGIGTTNLLASQVSLASTLSPTVSMTGSTNINGSMTINQRVLTINNGIQTLLLTFTVTPTVDAQQCQVKLQLQNRTSTNSAKTDISGAISGYTVSTNTALAGTVCFADTSSSNVIIQFIPNGIQGHVIQGLLTYTAN